MNSSKVNTRGLQHFHPINFLIYYIDFKERKREKKKNYFYQENMEEALVPFCPS